MMQKMQKSLVLFFLTASLGGVAHAAQPLECSNWQQSHPGWLWCDDFENDSSLSQNYFRVGRDGQFGVKLNDAPFGGNGSLRGTFTAGVEGAGGIMLSLGRNPTNPSGLGPIASNRDFTDLYWRFYMKTGSNWVGNAIKVTRATILASSSWTQAAIGHIWEDSLSLRGMSIDPATGVQGSTVVTTGYNDFSNLRWLGQRPGTTQVYSPENRGRWFCVEAHMKLNTPGQSDGVFAFWVDGHLEAQATNLNWRGSYTAYGINTVTLENWINDGAPQTQSRYYDNLVVSTAPIGCFGGPGATQPMPPTDVTVQ